jgi:predicted ATPase
VNIAQSSPRPSHAELARIYKDRHKKFSQAATELSRKSRRIENLRGATFAGLVIGAGYYFVQGAIVGGLIGLACALAFGFLIQHHGKLLEQEAHQRRFSIVNEHSLSRVTGDFHNLPRTGVNFASANHPYAGDLDLFGVASVYQRISVAHTRYGQKTLASWLSEPADKAEILLRQEAMSELAADLEFRQKLEAEGMALVEKKRGGTTTISDGPNPDRLLSWVKSPGALAQSPVVTLLSFLLPLATISGLYAHSALGVPPYWVVPLLLGMILLGAKRGETSDTFAAVSTTEGAFLRYGALLEHLEGLIPESPWLRVRAERLLSGKKARPSVVMRRFRTLVSWYDLRHNGMVYPFVNGVLLWDLHCTRALQRWKADVAGELENWFEVIGDFEAISSIAGLRADEPRSCVPNIEEADFNMKPVLEARGLAHPLLPPRSRVENDIASLAVGHALLVTGSNMSGKSTFLRSLGVNAVLAFAGGPTLASYFSLPVCQLGTSIRVSDSLKSGVSHFYAEVQKLAHVVELTEKRKNPVLFLLDEVLHGTNSRERQIGARWVLAELLQKGAFGIITTHDMELCRLPEDLMAQVRQHHFREVVHDGEMSFDYTLREGPVTSGNALRLMHRVGLKVPLEEPQT